MMHHFLTNPLGYLFRPLFLSGLYFMQDNMLFKPKRTDYGLLEPLMHPAAYKKYMLEGVEEVTLHAADGVRLNSWFKRPAGENSPVFLYLTGNTGHIGDCGPDIRDGKIRDDTHRQYRLKMFEHMCDMGRGALALVYRGYGGNEGIPTEYGLVDDAMAAYQFLLDQGIARERIVIVGDSLGGAVGIQLSEKVNAPYLVTLGTFSSVADKGHDLYVMIEADQFYPFLKHHFDSLSHIKKLHETKVLLIHGKSDATTPRHHSERLFKAAQAAGVDVSLEIMDGVGHVNYSPKKVLSLIGEKYNLPIV